MTTRKQKTKTTAPKALTISIHGDGIDVEVRLENSQLGQLIAEALTRINVPTASPTTASASQEASPPEHDFDVVRRVIEHADLAVLQAIESLTSHALMQRKTAS